MGEPKDCEAKGANFLALRSAMRLLRGSQGVQAMLDALEGPVAPLLREERLYENQWYPIAFYREIHRAAEVAAGEPIARRLGHHATKELFSKAYAIFARIVGPSTSWRHSSQAFQTFYRPAEVEVLSTMDASVRARVSGCPGFDERVWDDVIGSVEAIIEISGGKSPVTDVRQAAEDLSMMEIEVRWR